MQTAAMHAPLADDIVDRIMTFCPDFASLQATACVSKHFYHVYQTHPKSITRAVAYNVVGPALPQALRVIRYPYPEFMEHTDDDGDGDGDDEEDGGGGGGDDAVDPSTLCPETHEVTLITAEEKWRLLEEARTTAALEDIFSLRYKSRRSAHSALTPMESTRFRRALYRISLYCTLFPVSRYSLEEIEDLSDADIHKIRAQRAKLLAAFPTRELRELGAVERFLRALLREVLDGEDDRTWCSPPLVIHTLPLSEAAVDTSLAIGPEAALNAHDYRESGVVLDNLEFGEFDVPQRLFGGYIGDALARVWTARGLDPATGRPKKSTKAKRKNRDEEDEDATDDDDSEEDERDREEGDEVGEEEREKDMRDILDEVTGAHDTCDKCGAPGGLTLWTEATWPHLTLYPSQLLKGKLDANSGVFNTFAALVPIWSGGPELGKWVGKLFDFAATLAGGNNASSGGASGSNTAGTSSNANANANGSMGWTRSAAYCQACLLSFVQEHTWRWVLAERVKGGWVPPEDCWYGYSCNTQTHRVIHAAEKNHLCVPTRGTA
ncbi:hypothetical protein B0H10DRAFT_1985439 [Mycena sp. CBHHK59/15]|nr:hypothetical protein B0H10DRAFT_1985439 [Mycena sp. CBHHK59/15]